MSTKKFIGPIDTFKRLPFYLFDDDIVKNSVIFFDEFDSTKQVVLDQIIDDGLKNQIDIVGLFSDLHYALQNIVIPSKLLQMTDYNKDNNIYTVNEHFDFLRKLFKDKYNSNHMEYLMKSVDFNYDKAFLFDDGKYFNVIKDNSKKFICAQLDAKENFLALKECSKINDNKEINSILRELLFCIESFEKSMTYIYTNYMCYKNSTRGKNDIRFSDEEAIFTVLDMLNLSEDQKNYLFTKLQTKDFNQHLVQKDKSSRRGFSFTVIEDSNYHDIKSIARNYIFSQTPEDVFIKLAKKALVIGISATSNIKTCIGNYDLKYLCSNLNENYLTIKKEDEERIEKKFNEQIQSTRGKYNIHANLVDDFDVFSDKEKCEVLINNLFKDELKKKYINKLDEEKIDYYYFLIELKLTYIYNEICQKNIKSFIAFVNSFPKKDEKFNLSRLENLFQDITDQNKLPMINFEIVKADDFDNKFNKIKDKLANNETVFVLTTYSTIGSGKNIQYPIPNNCDSVVMMNSERNDKDFEGIFLLTPTNLIQSLSSESDDKFKDLSRFLFHQEYLYRDNKQTYFQMKSNIIAGFRKVFFNETLPLYTKNKDMQVHMMKIVIQAIGRICRCRNKNKNVYIYCDRVLATNVIEAYKENPIKMCNDEFSALLNINIKPQTSNKLESFSQQNHQIQANINLKVKILRQSPKNIAEWKALRDFVLKNPTTNNPGKYSEYYFCFDSAYTGYSYCQNNKYDIVKMLMDTRYDMNQVSESACELPTIMDIPGIPAFFATKGYARHFKKGKYIMSPSLFKQIYLGALGEVVGKFIIDKELGVTLSDLSDDETYEFFDYRFNDLYFDFKHWDRFRVDNIAYTNKVERKLKMIKGTRCFVINIIKRTEAKSKENISDNIVQIPYLFDPETGLINEEAIKYIQTFLY